MQPLKPSSDKKISRTPLRLSTRVQLLKDIYIAVSISLATMFFIVLFLEMVTRIRNPFDRAWLNKMAEVGRLKKAYEIEHLEWGNTYLMDMARYGPSKMYWPFEEYRNRPFTSKTINVSKNGFRITPGNYAKAKHSIWIFGGSTTFGVGVSDDFTIAAQLQRILRQQHAMNINVYNRGVCGAASSQEVISFIRQLQTGPAPDIVIFYDGYNDVEFALKSMTPGASTMQLELTDFFDGGNPLLYMIATRQHWTGSRVLSALFQWLRKSFHLPLGYVPYLEAPNYPNYEDLLTNQRNVKISRMPEKEQQQFAHRIYQSHKQNVDLIQKLSKVYGFKPFFYWQPNLFDKNKKPLSLFEKKLEIADGHPAFHLMQQIVQLIKEQNADHVRYVGDAFKDISETVYLDSAHVLPAGNRQIAEIMYSDLRAPLSTLTEEPAPDVTYYHNYFGEVPGEHSLFQRIKKYLFKAIS